MIVHVVAQSYSDGKFHGLARMHGRADMRGVHHARMVTERSVIHDSKRRCCMLTLAWM